MFVCVLERKSHKDKMSVHQIIIIYISSAEESSENNLVYPTFVLFLGRCKPVLNQKPICVYCICIA